VPEALKREQIIEHKPDGSFQIKKLGGNRLDDLGDK